MSLGLSSIVDRMEKSFRRMCGSVVGWRQVLRVGITCCSASPTAGPGKKRGKGLQQADGLPGFFDLVGDRSRSAGDVALEASVLWLLLLP